MTSAPRSPSNNVATGPASAFTNERTRTPSSGRWRAGPSVRRFAVFVDSKSSSGRAIVAAPCGSAAHSAGVRTRAIGRFRRTPSSSSSCAVFFSTARWMPSTEFTQSRWESRASRRCGWMPIMVTKRPSFAR